MVIARERYLDDSSQWLFSLALSSRTVAAHTVLTALTPEDRQAITDALGTALDAAVTVLRRRIPEGQR
jgi:methionine-rich copper-binding protein CopC